MQIIKYILLIVLFTMPFHILLSDEMQVANTLDRNMAFYAGINPLALIAFLPNGIGTVGTLWGTVSGQEFGISLYGGMYFADAHSVELRLSTGPADVVIWDTQIQVGYIWYPLKQFFDWNNGFNSGFKLRQFFWKNRITDDVMFNLTPEILAGWRFMIDKLAIDLRAGWNLASVTWSTIPNISAGIGWIPFPYNLTLTTGIAWVFN
jgi:hypothetical protein